MKFFLSFLLGAALIYFIYPLVLSEASEPRVVPDVFEEVRHIFDNRFYTEKPVDPEKLRYGLVEGFVDAHGDRHSEFFPPKVAQEFREFIDGDFEGIGAYVEEHELGVLIDRVIAGSPAKLSGITSGDIIIRAGEEELAGLAIRDAVSKIKGPRGSRVVLEFLRPGEEGSKEVEVTRQQIEIPSVTHVETDKEGVVIIWVHAFMGNTYENLSKELGRRVTTETKGLIIDLRDNGGGLLESAIDVLSDFIPENSPVVHIRGNKQQSYTEKTNKAPKYETPLVILVNENSASASEIVAGAVQDYDRGVVIGKTTYGKGSVQQSITLSDTSELKITTHHWFTPLERAIEWKGVVPDMEVEYSYDDFLQGKDPQLDAALDYLDTLDEVQT